jgi:hypothetical protein
MIHTHQTTPTQFVEATRETSVSGLWRTTC